MLNIEEIQKILPQRFPFLMVDRVIELEPGKKVVAIKNVSFNEEFFGGHFPGQPIMPGVLIIEAMAQSAIILFYADKEETADKKLSYYLGSVKVRFLNPAFPGDQLKITVEPIKIISGAALVNATVYAGDKEIAKGEMSFSVKEGHE
ncbi:MAG: 3-hydroxyacyl-ACP dehydratase FabZ [Candidatus Omnitrophica bacterium]|nr:3-hydroxyacyl-ACP dehydratase FabZ [Candidatus Omnitrophota bacterium]